MNIRDNSLASLFHYLKAGLHGIYDDREALNITRLFFEKTFGLKAVDIVLQAGRQFSESEILQVHFALKELKNFKPIQHITGRTDFMGMEIKVNEHVLIPRPETEELVRLAASRCPDSEETMVLDIGTGSGCIALGLKKLKPSVRIKGIDISDQALEVARENGRLLNLPVLFEKGDALRLPALVGVYDLIVSNPPYIARKEAAQMEENVLKHEPALALFAPEEDVLAFYRAMAAHAASALKPGGWLMMEINPAHSDAIAGVFEKNGLHEVKIYHDLQDRPRICTGRCIGA